MKKEPPIIAFIGVMSLIVVIISFVAAIWTQEILSVKIGLTAVITFALCLSVSKFYDWKNNN